MATYNLDIKAGATYRKSMVWKDGSGNPIDLTGYSARMQIRQTVDSSNVMLSLTSPDDIIIDALNGKIDIIILDNITSGLVDGVYDLELISPTIINGRNVVDRILEGTVSVSKNVTR